MSWMSIIAMVVLAYIFQVDGASESTCKEFVSMVTKKQLGGIGACTKTMKFKNPKDKAAKMNCILKCVLKKEGFIDETGQLIGEDKYDGFIEAYVPTNLIDKIVPKFKSCKERVGKLDDTDEFCKSIDPFIKCLLEVVGTLCKE